MSAQAPQPPFAFDPLIAEAKRRARRRRSLVAIVALIICGSVLGGVLALRSPQGPGAGGPPASTPNPHDVSAQNAADTVVRGRLSVGGVKWTAYTYTSPLGRCLEVSARTGSVDGCGSTAAFTWGIGGLQVGHTWYAVPHGFAPPAAASARVKLENGTTIPSAETYVGNEVWFVIHPATATAPADDVKKVELLDRNGRVIRSVRPPSVSAYVRASRLLARGGR